MHTHEETSMKIVITLNRNNDKIVRPDGTIDRGSVAKYLPQFAEEFVVQKLQTASIVFDEDGTEVFAWAIRPKSAISRERAKALLKEGNAAFGNYSKFATPEEDREIRRIWAHNPSPASSYYSTLARIAAGDYE